MKKTYKNKGDAIVNQCPAWMFFLLLSLFIGESLPLLFWGTPCEKRVFLGWRFQRGCSQSPRSHCCQVMQMGFASEDGWQHNPQKTHPSEPRSKRVTDGQFGVWDKRVHQVSHQHQGDTNIRSFLVRLFKTDGAGLDGLLLHLPGPSKIPKKGHLWFRTVRLQPQRLRST